MTNKSIDFTKFKGELQSFACFDKAKWLNQDGSVISLRADEEVLEGTVLGSREHTLKSIWEYTLDPQGTNKKKDKVKDEELFIDWKRWPPPVPSLPLGIKIPVTEVRHVDIRMSPGGSWNKVFNGTAVLPVNKASSKFFNTLGGYLNVAKSTEFRVEPVNLMFLNYKIGHTYKTTLIIHNKGPCPRRLCLLTPPKPHLTVERFGDPSLSISSGRNVKFEVTFKPRTQANLNDLLIFYVDGDGAVTVPVITSGLPEPILEVEEWNCGCCVVGVARQATFEVKNVGGGSRFWIVTEDEFTNEKYLECYLKYQRDLVMDNARDLLTQHTDEMTEALKQSKPPPHPNAGMLGVPIAAGNAESSSKVPIGGAKMSPKIYTKCFRIGPSCFRLQRHQKIEIKIRYLPKTASFHYEKLAILCDNGEVRWVAVKGLGIARNSNSLMDIKAPWTGPPVDLPFDIRTRYVLDLGDLLPGEVGQSQITLTNKSCVPLYFFWSVRPLLPDPSMEPTEDMKIMEHFYEYTIYERDSLGKALFVDGQVHQEFLDPVHSPPLSIGPAQGLLERKSDLTLTINVTSPEIIGYHGFVISLFAEQVDEESRDIVEETLNELDQDQIQMPISHVELEKQLEMERGYRNEDYLGPESLSDSHESPVKKLYSLHTSLRVESEAVEIEDVDFIPLKNSILDLKEVRSKMLAENLSVPMIVVPEASAHVVDESLLPFVVVMRSSMSHEWSHDHEHEEHEVVLPLGMKSEGRKSNVAKTESQDTHSSGHHSLGRRESLNIHILQDNEDAEDDREMGQGHAVYEPLNLYTEALQPRRTLHDISRDLMPVAEVEIWLRSVPFDLEFQPNFLIARGKVRGRVERLIKVKNGSCHAVEIEMDNYEEKPIQVIWNERRISVEPYSVGVLKAVVYIEGCGEIRRILEGRAKLPFRESKVGIAAVLKGEGPFLEVLTPMLNFGIVPFMSETMKTVAVKNCGLNHFKWIARIPFEGLEDENKRQLSGHQARVLDKKLFRIWPEWGWLGPGESSGFQVYFSAEIGGQIATHVEVMVESNPESLMTVPVYGEVEQPNLVLENGLIQFYADDFPTQPSQTGKVVIINPTGFNVPFVWESPMGRQCKLCSILIHPKNGVVQAKSRVECCLTIQTNLKDEPLDLDNFFIPCCVKGMKEPLILKLETIYD